jgi:hypothetical protein
MDPVIIVFVLATGFVSLTFVLPLLFWYTERGPTVHSTPQPPYINPVFQIKAVPPTLRPNSGTSPLTPYQVKVVPGVRLDRTRRIAV